jgi:hypothetical protein
MIHYISEHPRNREFLKRGKLSVDGAAWAVEKNWPDWKWGEGKPNDLAGRAEVMADIAKFRQRFIDEFGDEQFGYVEIPSEELWDSIRGDEDWGYYEENDLREQSLLEYDVPTWPVILSPFPDETLQDGWHRFFRYHHLKMVVPVLWYVD